MLTLIFFAILHYVIYFALEKYLPKWYEIKDKKDRLDVLQLLAGMVHHVAQVVIAVINITYLCDKVAGQFRCDQDCLLTYKPFVSHAGMITLGYFACDLGFMLFVTRDKSPITI